MAKASRATKALEQVMNNIDEYAIEGVHNIPIEKIQGYADKTHLPANAPKTRNRTSKSVSWHQLQPILLNLKGDEDHIRRFLRDPTKNNTVTVEVIDGRDRTQSRRLDEIATIEAKCYKNLPNDAVELMSNFTQQYRRRNWIQVYRSVIHLKDQGINPTTFKNTAFALNKRDVKNCLLISTLHEDLLDAFMGGFLNFSMATRIARQEKEVQDILVTIYQTEGRFDAGDIKRARNEAAEQSADGDDLTMDDVAAVQERTWEDTFKLNLSRLDSICPKDSKYRAALDELLAQAQQSE